MMEIAIGMMIGFMIGLIAFRIGFWYGKASGLREPLPARVQALRAEQRRANNAVAATPPTTRKVRVRRSKADWFE